MTLDEVKAAAPDATWRDSMVSKFTGRVFALRSVGTVPIHGTEFDVAALAHYYQHGLRFDAAVRVKDATECERTGLALLAAIEPQAGPLESHAPRRIPPGPNSVQWHVQSSSGGSISLTPALGIGTPGRTEGESVKFGTASTALVEAFDELHRNRSRGSFLGKGPAFLRVTAFRRGQDYAVDAEVTYSDDGELNCAAHIELQRWTQPPLPQRFDGAKAKVVGQMSIAERHLALSPGMEPVRAATDVELLCDVDRIAGWTYNCGIVAPEDLTAGQQAAALRQARALAFDMNDVDRDDPQMMRGPVYVRLDPDDRKPIDFLEQPRTELADVTFDDQPDAEDVTRAYPVLVPALEGEVVVTLTCRIQVDGSLICGGAKVSEPEQREAFEFSAYRLAGTRYRVAPALRSGAPSAGRVIDLSLSFTR